MRVTQAIMSRNALQIFSEKRTNLNKLQTAISTGKEVQNASDDPVRFSRAARFKNALNQNDQYQKNVDDGNAWVDATMSALDDIQSVLMDAKDIALNAADGTSNEDLRSRAAANVDSILDNVISLANTRHLNKNLFGGTMTVGADAFTKTGATVNYSGNSELINRKVSQNMSVSINTTGQDLVDAGIFDALTNLRDALANNDVDGIRGSIDALSTAEQNVSTLAATAGSVSNSLDMISQRLQTMNLNLNAYISGEENVDLAEAMMKYESEDTAYRAAMEVANKVMNLNVLDYLNA